MDSSSSAPPRSIQATTLRENDSALDGMNTNSSHKNKNHSQQQPIISATSESTQFFLGNNNNNPAAAAGGAGGGVVDEHRELIQPVQDSGLPRSPRRGRINSRDIPRTYSGLYGKEDDFLPLECGRPLQRGAITAQSIWFLLVTYLTLIVVVQQVVASSFHILSSSPAPSAAAAVTTTDDGSWTWTHAIHTIVTVSYIHWLKGSIFGDPQGELNALTIWEQLEARGSQAKAVRQLLLLVPTVLTYLACHWSQFRPEYCLINVCLWAIEMLAKLPFMNGVRLFGINRTVGIDDDDCVADDDNNHHQGTAAAASVAALTSNNLATLVALQEKENEEDESTATSPDKKKTR